MEQEKQEVVNEKEDDCLKCYVSDEASGSKCNGCDHVIEMLQEQSADG